MNSKRSRQAGITLVISLILLLVMTILGVAAIRIVNTEERMAANTYDRSLAFQAAESTLKSVEDLIEIQKPQPTSGCALVNNLMSCAAPLPSSTPRWSDTSFTSWQDATTVGAGSLAITPKYFVEYLGDTFNCRPGDPSDPSNCKRYRVTARVGGSDGRASVMLQSIYATD